MRRALVLASLCGCDDFIFGGTVGPEIEQEGYAGVVAIADASCLACHSAAAAQGQLDLETNLHAATVEVPSGNAGFVLVVPGSPDESLLYLKVANQPPSGTGTEMPPGSGGLPEDQLAIVRGWIEDGAPDQ